MAKSKKSPLIIGNWKMHTTVSEAEALVKDMLTDLEQATGVDKVICPPFVSLAMVKHLLDKCGTMVGAQNMHYADEGAYTGEVSPLMLKGLCDYVILGHSERRQYFCESSEIINLKVKAAFRHGLKPVLCIGENWDENNDGCTSEVLQAQLEGALEGISNITELTIAYEPVWAIGSGKVPDKQVIVTILEFVRHVLSRLYGEEAAAKTRLLYGGSVDTDNCADIISLPGVDGLLVGSRSVQKMQFLGIISAVRTIARF